MKVVFVTWAGGGNTTPVLGLGTRLMRRGHEVVALSPDERSARFEVAGLAFEQIGRSAGDVLEAVQRSAPDVAVVDFMSPAWMCAAEASGTPWIALVHTLYDRVAVGIITAFMTLDQINGIRREVGLDAVARDADLLDRAERVMVTAPRELDATASVGDNVEFVGTVLEEPAGDDGWRPPVDDRPLVVVSLGTTMGLGDEEVLPRVTDAVAELPVHAVVNLRTGIELEGVVVPPNVTVTDYIPHAAVLPHAALMVNHAGLGSSVAALSYGVPLVCIPLGRDQPHNAERLAATGVAVAVEPSASVGELRGAIERVLADPQYRAAAAPFADAYDPDARAAIAIIESLGKSH